MNTPTAIFDIDGVLADSWHRRSYITRIHPDYDGFFEACDRDPALPLCGLPSLLEDAGYEVFYVTSRPLSVFRKTKAWLQEHLEQSAPPRLVMRPEDREDGDSWKVEVITRLVHRFDVEFIFEDSPNVVRMLKMLKLPVVPILSGYYDWKVPRWKT